MGAAAESLTLEKDTPTRSAEAGVHQTAPASSAFDPFVQKLFGSAPSDPLASLADSLSVQRFRAPVLQRAQRLYGNRASQQIVMRTHTVQRQCACGGTCAKCQEEEQQRQVQRQVQTPVQRSSAATTPAEFDGIPASAGEQLDPATRRPMEAHFGADLADVRVHTGSEAAKSATNLDALAYTSGRDIYFATGMYAPAGDSGRRLLAHEVAHVVQQGSGKEPAIAHKLSHAVKIGAPEDMLEGEADQAAEAFMSGSPLADEEQRKGREAGSTVQRFIQRQDDGGAPAPEPTPAPVFGPPSVADLRQEYTAALANARATGNWQDAAEKLNIFNHEDIQNYLAQLSDSEVGYLHQGAVDNPRVGPDSNVAKKTLPGAPQAAAPQQGAKQDAGAPAAANHDDQASRDRQVACVINEGGCPSSRSGGLASPEEMHNYNQKCRETSKFAGPDITPSEEECKNPPKPSPLPAAGGQEGEWTTGEVVLVGTAVVIGAALIIVFAPELIPLAATFARGAIVALRIGTAVATTLPAAAAGGDAVVLAEVTATAVEAAPAVAEGGAVAVRGAQVLNLVVRSAQPIAQAVQASAPAAQIAVTSSAPTLAQAAAAITGAGASATLLKSDSPNKKDDKDEEPSCIVGRYGSIQCLPGEQAHHIVADYTLRFGTRAEGITGQKRIPGLPSFNDGPAICLKGHRTVEGDQHNIAHEADAEIEALGAAGSPKGTAAISAITAISIAGATNAKNCPATIVAGVAQQPTLLGSTPARTTIMPPGKWPP